MSDSCANCGHGAHQHYTVGRAEAWHCGATGCNCSAYDDASKAVKVLRARLDTEHAALLEEIHAHKWTREALRVVTLALRGMVDSHTDRCIDDRNEICPSCVMAVVAIEDRTPQGAKSVLAAEGRGE